MYNPSHFQELRADVIDDIIKKFPLGCLVYSAPGGMDAVHLPFVPRNIHGEGGTLVGHVARSNPIWNEIEEGSEVLVIFKAGDAYISPNWYPSKHETHRMVPTWNYQVAHVRGRIHFVHDAKTLRSSVALLTHIQERAAGESKPWRLADGEKDYIARMLEAIVGIEIEVTSVEGKSKLSQNREQGDRAGVISELRKRGHDVVADSMEAAVLPLADQEGK